MGQLKEKYLNNLSRDVQDEQTEMDTYNVRYRPSTRPFIQTDMHVITYYIYKAVECETIRLVEAKYLHNHPRTAKKWILKDLGFKL